MLALIIPKNRTRKRASSERRRAYIPGLKHLGFTRITVTDELQPGDLIQFQRFWWSQKSRIKPWMMIAGLLALLLVSDLPLWGNWRSMLFSFFLPMPVIAIFSVLLFPMMVARQARASPGFVGFHTMAINPVGLIQKTSVTETKVQWQSVVDITKDAKQIYFFLNQRSAFLVPMRSFADAEDAQLFLQTARAYWENPGHPLPDHPERSDSWPPSPQTLKP